MSDGDIFDESTTTETIRRHQDLNRFDVNTLITAGFAEQTLIVVNINLYGRLMYKRNLCLPGEISLVAFNLKDGIKETYSSVIDPGEIPKGSALVVKTAVHSNGLKYPGHDAKYQDTTSILNDIHGFMDRVSHSASRSGGWPPMLCLQEQIELFYGCMNWLSANSRGLHAPTRNFRLRSLEILMLRASVEGRRRRDELYGIEVADETPENKGRGEKMTSTLGSHLERDLEPQRPRVMKTTLLELDENRKPYSRPDKLLIRNGKFLSDSHALDYLSSSYNQYNEELACDYHKKAYKEGDDVHFCSELNAKRLAINAVDALKSLFVLEAVAGGDDVGKNKK